MSEPLLDAPVPNLAVGRGLLGVLAAVLLRLETELAGTAGGPVARAVLAPGSGVPADGCCGTDEGSGQCHVRLSRMYPTRRFPAADTAYSRLPMEFTVEVEIGVYRCVSGLDDQGEPPTPGEMGADTAVATDDLAAMQATALGVFGVPVVLGQYTALGPTGYCAGGTLTFALLFNPGCPPGSM